MRPMGLQRLECRFHFVGIGIQVVRNNYKAARYSERFQFESILFRAQCALVGPLFLACVPCSNSDRICMLHSGEDRVYAAQTGS